MKNILHQAHEEHSYLLHLNIEETLYSTTHIHLCHLLYVIPFYFVILFNTVNEIVCTNYIQSTYTIRLFRPFLNFCVMFFVFVRDAMCIYGHNRCAAVSFFRTEKTKENSFHRIPIYYTS